MQHARPDQTPQLKSTKSKTLYIEKVAGYRPPFYIKGKVNNSYKKEKPPAKNRGAKPKFI